VWTFQGGSDVRVEAAAQSAILNRLLPGTAYPLTFCVASRSKIDLLRPWPKAFTLQELSEAQHRDFDDDDYISREEVLAIVFQLIWTLAVLTREFPGFQHNAMATSVRLYSYGGARCYKIRDSQGIHLANGTAFYLRKSLPLPVIVKWSECNCSSNNSDIPYRTSPATPGKDLTDLLSAMIGTGYEDVAKDFRVLAQIRNECTLYFTRIKLKPLDIYGLRKEGEDEFYLDKREIGENICIPQILALECPEGFSPLASRSSETLVCAKCSLEVGNPHSQLPQLVQRNGTYQCKLSHNGIEEYYEPILSTEMTSKYFQDFLDPIEVSNHGIAIVNGF
jgi:hypothetical protein